MTRHSVLMIICAGLALPSLTACQKDGRSLTSLSRDDSVVQDQARERDVANQLATSRTR